MGLLKIPIVKQDMKVHENFSNGSRSALVRDTDGRTWRRKYSLFVLQTHIKFRTFGILLQAAT
jgi:hypothetical protein